MKIGIIINFHNNEKDIDPNVFIKQFIKTSHLQFCLVNNASKDNTFELLNEIKNKCCNVSVVNVKKFKSDISAIRAGARYMSSQFDLNHLGYVSINLLNISHHGLKGLIEAISENQQHLLKFNIQELNNRKIKLSLFQSLFSIVDYLKKIKVENQFIKIQYLCTF